MNQAELDELKTEIRKGFAYVLNLVKENAYDVLILDDVFVEYSIVNDIQATKFSLTKNMIGRRNPLKNIHPKEKKNKKKAVDVID